MIAGRRRVPTLTRLARGAKALEVAFSCTAAAFHFAGRPNSVADALPWPISERSRHLCEKFRRRARNKCGHMDLDIAQRIRAAIRAATRGFANSDPRPTARSEVSFQEASSGCLRRVTWRGPLKTVWSGDVKTDGKGARSSLFPLVRESGHPKYGYLKR